MQVCPAGWLAGALQGFQGRPLRTMEARATRVGHLAAMPLVGVNVRTSCFEGLSYDCLRECDSNGLICLFLRSQIHTQVSVQSSPQSLPACWLGMSPAQSYAVCDWCRHCEPALRGLLGRRGGSLKRLFRGTSVVCKRNILVNDLKFHCFTPLTHRQFAGYSFG
jgi:hypothetical protein